MGKRLDELNAQFSERILEKNKKRYRKYRMYGIFVCSLVVAVTAGMIINSFLFGFGVIQGKSMEPTFKEGDIVFARKYDVSAKKGDLVIFDQPNALKGYLIKRVIATAGDTVNIDGDGKVYVNGAAFETDKAYFKKDVDIPVTVPDGKLFVLGDGGDQSVDSRYSFVGLIDDSAVKGIAV